MALRNIGLHIKHSAADWNFLSKLSLAINKNMRQKVSRNCEVELVELVVVDF